MPSRRTALRVLNATTGREIVRMPLGETAEQRYGAPYWVIHRGDLQAALAAAVPAISTSPLSSACGSKISSLHANGLTVSAHGRAGVTDEHGVALLAPTACGR